MTARRSAGQRRSLPFAHDVYRTSTAQRADAPQEASYCLRILINIPVLILVVVVVVLGLWFSYYLGVKAALHFLGRRFGAGDLHEDGLADLLTSDDKEKDNEEENLSGRQSSGA